MKTRLLLILALVLAACGGDEAATTTEVPVESSDVAAATTVAETTTTTTAPTTTVAETTTTTAAPLGGADCVVGVWEFDSQSFVDGLLEQFGGEVPGEVSFGGGSYTIELSEDGTMTAVRDNWQFRFDTPEGAIVNTINGSDSGTYSIEGSMMTVTSSASDVTVTVQAEVNGELVELPFGGPQTIDQDPFTGTGTFECGPDTLTVTFEGATTVLNRS